MEDSYNNAEMQQIEEYKFFIEGIFDPIERH